MRKEHLQELKKNGKTGLFQLANGGVLFLDEIGELEYGLQGKLLRVLQEKSIRKIGGSKEIPIDVRLICATNKDLFKLMEEGKFRRDLYYRIAIIPLTIPPLRERKDDIPALANKFISDLSQKYKKDMFLSQEAIQLLKEYEWCGNIRELKNIIEFTFNMREERVILKEHLPIKVEENILDSEIIELKEYINKVEKEYINKAIAKYGDSVEGKKKAAKALGISLATFYNKLNR